MWIFFAKLAFLVATAGILIRLTLGRIRARRAFQCIALLASSITIALAASEFLTRVIFRDITTTARYGSFFTRRWLHVNPPRINRYGFRDVDFASRPAPNVFRIAVIGDSFTYGQGISTADRMTEILADRLGAGFEVLNCGISGTSTVDHTRALRDVVLPLEPDFVLLQWFVNDAEGADTRSRPAPIRMFPSDTLSNILHAHSALYYVLNQQWEALQGTLGLVGSHLDYMESRFGDAESADSRAARAELEKFIAIAARGGVPMGIIAFPMLGADGAGSDFPLSYMIDRVLETCSKFEIRCVDLRPDFRGVAPRSRLWANRLDAHPGRLANEIAAENALRTFQWDARN